jgi:hypothetical protein
MRAPECPLFAAAIDHRYPKDEIMIPSVALSPGAVAVMLSGFVAGGDFA